MAVRANPDLIEELEHFGAHDAMKCYQCGNCTAACSHAEDASTYPRRSIHYLQMGLEKPLRSTLDPWLCYYCGKCSEQCPRGAEPGETMMGIRRWLTAEYDFTGIARRLYRSWTTELAAVLALALLTGIGFFAFGFLRGGGNLSVYDGPGAFLPAHSVHIFDWTMGITLAILLNYNCVRMWQFTMRNENALPVRPGLYLRHLLLLPEHFFTQKRLRACENKTPWVTHMVLMFSYLTMLALIMLFLKDMQSGPQVNWYVHFFGYLSAIGLVTTSILAIRGRIKKTEPYQQHSHESDWMFLGLLLFVSVTGVVQHVAHRLGMPMTANIVYVIHLMGVVPMLVLEVPFSKWSHLAYRPLAIYFSALQQAARAEGAVSLGEPSKPQPAA
jgi:ferredoxin